MEMKEDIWDVNRLLKWTSGFFKDKELNSPRLSAEVLLSSVMGWGRMDLYTRFDYVLEKDKLTQFREFVAKASSGYPVSYIIGEKEFYSIAFKVDSNVLIPRPETELLVDAATEFLRSLDTPGRVWDVCTGSGCVAAAIASNASVCRVLATDVSPGAVNVATENIKRLELDSIVSVCQTDLLDVPDDWNELFDCITANPPYVALGDQLGEGVDNEPAIALFAGNDGLDLIRPLIAGVSDKLADGGLFCMEFGAGQEDRIITLVAENIDLGEPEILVDIQGIPRALVVNRKSR